MREVTLRQDDTQGIELLQAHLLEQPGGVWLVSTQPSVLDSFGRAFVQRLRAHAANGALQVAVFIDMSREFLLERFSQALVSLTIDEARRVERSPKPRQVWVLHAQTDEQADQGRLVMRFVTEFPGANVRLLVLANASADEALRQTEEGRQMLRCLVLPADAAVVPEGVSSTLGRTAGAVSAGADTPSQSTQMHDAAASASSVGSGPLRRRRLPGLVPVLGVGVLLLALSIVLVFIMQPQSFLAQRAAVPALEEAARAPAAEPETAASLPLPTQPTTVPATSAPTAPAQDAAVATPAEAAGTSAVSDAVLRPEPEKSEPKPSGKPAAVPVATTSVPALGSSALPTETAAESLASDMEWIRNLGPGQWVVHHTNFRTVDDARRWRDRHAAIRDARIVELMAVEEGKRQFAVVSGPFESLADATKFAQSRSPAKFRVRGASSIQRNLAEIGATR